MTEDEIRARVKCLGFVLDLGLGLWTRIELPLGLVVVIELLTLIYGSEFHLNLSPRGCLRISWLRIQVSHKMVKIFVVGNFCGENERRNV